LKIELNVFFGSYNVSASTGNMQGTVNTVQPKEMADVSCASPIRPANQYGKSYTASTFTGLSSSPPPG